MPSEVNMVNEMEKHLLWQSLSMTFNWTFRRCLLFKHKTVWDWTDFHSTPGVKWYAPCVLQARYCWITKSWRANCVYLALTVWNWTDFHSTPWVKWYANILQARCCWITKSWRASELCVSSINLMKLNWSLLYAWSEVICTIYCKLDAVEKRNYEKWTVCIPALTVWNWTDLHSTPWVDWSAPCAASWIPLWRLKF